MTKSQAIQNLQSAQSQCAQYLQLKLQSNDFHGSAAVLMELADIKAQLVALSVEFEPEPTPAVQS